MQYRLLKPGATGAYRSILARTSADDRYLRYLRAVDGWEPAIVDRRDEALPRIGIVAEEDGMPLGVAHAAAVDARTAEIAVIVAQDARRRGVARGLVTALIDHLQAAGYEHIVASSLRENAGFAHVAAAVGLHVTGVDGALVTWGLELARPAIAV